MHCGCVLVRNKHVLASGYNGSLPGLPHCEDVGCLLVDNHCIRTNHAEMNAITQAAKNGVSIEGATAYVTNMPCTTCAKALIGAGIKRVVVFSDYHSTHAEAFFKDADVRLDRQEMPGKEINYNLESFSSARKF
jgi:dCMP deaminase